MKVIGLLLILGGVWLCWSVVLWVCGVAAIGAGALLCIAGWRSASGRFARATQWTLGALIGCSVLAPAVVFFVYALGFGPGQHPMRAGTAIAPAAQHSAQSASTAKRHPATH
jgi:hypothetical protein